MERWATHWAGLPAEQRRAGSWLVLCMALFCVQQVLYSPWYVEDAAISFTFAHHFSMGEGWVVWPGGEWVEGFSNPTWTLLLAVTDWLGPNPFWSAKIYGLLFGLISLPLSWMWARRLHDDPWGPFPLLAPLYLAVSPQFAQWCASGLENPLFILAMAAGCGLLVREVESERPGVGSAIAFGVLGISRPEAPLYVAVAGGVALLFRLRHGPKELLWFARWTAVAATPWVAYQGYRYWVFAWPFPNTYYAKLAAGGEPFQPLNWGGQGWNYLRGWAYQTGWGALLPFLPFLALRGSQNKRRAALVLTAVLLLLWIPGLHWLRQLPISDLIPAEPEALVRLRVGVMLAMAIVLPFGFLGRPRAFDRTLAWSLVCIVWFFALYSGGDWMKGHRWLSLCVLPLAILFSDLVGQMSQLSIPIPWAWARTALWSAPVLVGGVVQSQQVIFAPETSPFDVYRRVAYMQLAQERLHLDHVVNMEVDFGAQMWWTGDELLDMAGLNDTAIGHHTWEHPFIEEYILNERKPHFAHAHGGWKAKVGLGAHAGWRAQYVQIPHYPVGRRHFHVGNHVRRDTFMLLDWPHQTLDIHFSSVVRLRGLYLPQSQVAAGETLYLEVGWATQDRLGKNFRALLVLTGPDGQTLSWDLPPAYDWLAPPKWARREIAVGRHSLTLPDDTPRGTYDLSLVVIGPESRVIPRDNPDSNTRPRYARGEWTQVGAVDVIPVGVAVGQTLDAQEELIRVAEDGDCKNAEGALQVTRRGLSANHPYNPWSSREVHQALAECWAAVAQQSTDDAAAIQALTLAKRHDHRNATVQSVSRSWADEWEARGDAAWGDDDAHGAYDGWALSLRADPSRAWVRRRAEEARDIRLELESSP